MELTITNNIVKLVDSIADLYTQEIIDSGATASGELQNFTTKMEFNGSHFQVWFNLQEYWKYIEYGTKPHFPPINKIEQWIRIKPIVPDSRNGKVPTTKQLAFLISRSISQKGTKPKHLLEKTMTSQPVQLLIDQLKYELITQIKQKLYDKIPK